jgi:hypothetical protein
MRSGVSSLTVSQVVVLCTLLLLAISALAAPSADQEAYVAGLQSRGYIASIDRSTSTIRVVVGPAFDGIPSPKSHAELCQVLLDYFRAADEKVSAVEIISGSTPLASCQ